MDFEDRKEAGQKLAEKLMDYKGKNAMILAFSEGGVPIGHEIAHALGVPLNAMAIEKIPVPGDKNTAVGDVSELGESAFNVEEVKKNEVSQRYLEYEGRRRQDEAKRNGSHLRSGRLFPELKGKTVILVTDGLTEIYPALAAIKSVKDLKPAEIILATPIIDKRISDSLQREADKIISLDTPASVGPLAGHYHHFKHISESEAANTLTEAWVVLGND